MKRDSESPLLSIVVPIFRVEKYLMTCLNSILNQTYKNLEVFLVDEGEHDQCYAIMKFFESEDSRFHIIHKKHGGYSSSCNAGILAARGKYLAIVESDDILDERMYELLIAEAERTNAEVTKCSFYEYFELPFNRIRRETPSHPLIGNIPKSPFTLEEYPNLLSIHASIWAGIYRRDFLIDKQILFEEIKPQMYVDVGFRIRTLFEASCIAWVDKALYNWRLTNEGSTTNNYKLSAMIARWSEMLPYLQRNGELFNKAMPYLLCDQYYCCLSYFYNSYPATQQDFFDIQLYLSQIPDVVINTAPRLTSQEKDCIFKLKTCNSLVAAQSVNTNIGLVNVRVEKSRFRTNPVYKVISIIFRLFSFSFSISKKGISLVLFSKIRRRIFSTACNIRGRNIITITLGRPD